LLPELEFLNDFFFIFIEKILLHPRIKHYDRNSVYISAAECASSNLIQISPFKHRNMQISCNSIHRYAAWD